MHSYVNSLIYGTCAMNMNAYKMQPTVQTIIGDDAIAVQIHWLNEKRHGIKEEEEKKISKIAIEKIEWDISNVQCTYTMCTVYSVFRGSYGYMKCSIGTNI